MATDPVAAPQQPTDSTNHGVRVVVAWIVLSSIATPLVAIYVGPLIPPGNATVQGQGQTFSNQVMTGLLTPVLCLLAVFFAYGLVQFRARRNEAVVDGPPLRNDGRIQLLWIVITSAMVLFLAGFGTYELLKDGAGGGQGPNPIALPAHHQDAYQVQVIGQQWQFTYRYPALDGLESNQLVLPANTLIELHVTSLDVVHSFWAVELGVKADANPGVDNVALRRDEEPDDVPRPLRRALRALARLHVQQRQGRRLRAVHLVGLAAAEALRLDRALHEQAARQGRSAVRAHVPPRADEESRMTEASAPSRAAAVAPPDRLQPPDRRRPRRRRLVPRLVRRPPRHRAEHRLLRRHRLERAVRLPRLHRRRGRLPRRPRLPQLPVRPRCAATRRRCARRRRSGSERYFGLCTDHKVVGIQYLWGIGLFFFIGGLNAMLIRSELLSPTPSLPARAST